MASTAPTVRPHAAMLATLALALACNHTDPFSTPPYGTTTPFDPTPPARLTLNQGPDRDPVWRQDGSGVLYSTQLLSRPDADVCLAELPATGGTQRRLDCDVSGGGAAVTEVIATPALSSEGRLAFVRASSSVGGSNPSLEQIVVAPTLDPTGASEVQHIPYTIPGEPAHSAVIHLRWLTAERLVFVGGLVDYFRECRLCVLDTTVSGLQVVLLDLASGAGPAPLPGTDYASSAAPGTADEVYFTLGGDSRVYRRTLSSGATDVVHDFGGEGIARDVDVAGGRLAAVVGGRVAFGMDARLGPIQWDSGGVVHVVDLSSGGDVALAGPGLFRHPVISPAGGGVVAEGYPLIIQDLGGGLTDTTVSRSGDLYLFEVP
jgi:hypothetical protein